MNWVADYPFLLKDRCRMDTADFIFPPQHGLGVLSKSDGFLQMDDWPAHARQLPTLEQELARLPGQLKGLTYVLADTVSMRAVKRTASLG